MTAAERVQKFLDEYARMGSLDEERIYHLQPGVEDREAALTVSDLQELVNIANHVRRL